MGYSSETWQQKGGHFRLSKESADGAEGIFSDGEALFVIDLWGVLDRRTSFVVGGRKRDDALPFARLKAGRVMIWAREGRRIVNLVSVLITYAIQNVTILEPLEFQLSVRQSD